MKRFERIVALIIYILTVIVVIALATSCNTIQDSTSVKTPSTYQPNMTNLERSLYK